MADLALMHPCGVAVDLLGNVYIADSGDAAEVCVSVLERSGLSSSVRTE